MNIIQNQSFGAERALYHLTDAAVIGCKFAGPEDGESALKEARNISVEACQFDLRYPLWHVHNLVLSNCTQSETCRAALWYVQNANIQNCILGGIKALRECQQIQMFNCQINSEEFGWKCKEITIENSAINSVYAFLQSSTLHLNNIEFSGKYSFQYVKDLTIEDSVLDTKDAFWHAENVVVKNSVIKGEYLGWYSSNVTLDHCKIIGTQPLCYCKGLKLIDCTTENCDLAFEYSEVEATITGHVDSIKNPLQGTILCDSVGQTIHEDPVYNCTGKVIIRS